jgi:hypothetical protein
VGKYGTARRATDVSITRRMRLACWLTLSLLMSYMYGAPSKAKNLTYIYIYMDEIFTGDFAS